MANRSKFYGEMLSNNSRELSEIILSSYRGIKELKVYNFESEFINKFKEKYWKEGVGYPQNIDQLIYKEIEEMSIFKERYLKEYI